MDVIVLSEHDSDNSIIEVEVPKKASPPLVQIDEDDIIINANGNFDKKPAMENAADTESKPEVVVLNDPGDNFKEPLPWHRHIDISRLISPKHWTKDMIKFYNEDWGNESYFSVENLQRQMDQRPHLWQISTKDWMLLNQPKRNFIYCHNCHQPGHTVNFCNELKTPAKCHMCGIQGHTSYQCPNAVCLSCGNKTRNYHVGCTRCALRNGRICTRCSMRGHCLVQCPDHWRLYHLTLSADKIVVPSDTVYKKEADIWCCNCGKKGHHQYRCNEPKNKDGYGLTVPYVMSYEREFAYLNDPNKQLTNKELKKMKKAVRLLNLKQLNKPRDLSAPKKELSRKAVEKFKNRKVKFGKAWLKKYIKKKKKNKNLKAQADSNISGN